MTADPKIKERLSRAADPITVDVEDRLTRLHGSSTRRRRLARAGTMAIAAAIAVAALVLLLQILPSHRGGGATAGLTGTIAYTAVEGKNGPYVAMSVPAAGGSPADLAQGTSVTQPVYSPDGTKVAFMSGPSGGDRLLEVMDADGSGRHVVLATGGDSPAWSPDGSQIAFVSYTGTTGTGPDVHIVNADGTGDHVVVRGSWYSVSWSPDGLTLAIAGTATDVSGADPVGQFDIYTVGVDGSGLTKLTDTPTDEQTPTWSPDGSRIAYALTNGTLGGYDRISIWVMNADGSDPRQLTDRKGLDQYPVWSPDGSMLAFSSDRGATPDQQAANTGGSAFAGVGIYVMNADGANVQLVLPGGNAGFLPSSWTAQPAG